MKPRDRSSRRPAPSGAGLGLFVAAVLVIGLNQRPAITSIPPVQDRVAADLGMGPALTGALTSIPLVCFALVGLVVPGLVRRFGTDRTMLGGLVLLAVGAAVRPWSGVVLLFAGTVAVGAAITVANVLQPVVVRRDASARVGTLMPLSTASLSLGAALSSLVAVDAERLLGWRTTLAVVAVPALLAALLWLLRMRAARADGTGGADSAGAALDVLPRAVPGSGGRRRTPWAEGSAWWLAAYFGAQSALFYVAAAWLPAILADRAGATRAEGGVALSIFFLVGIVGSLTSPLIARALGSYRRVSPLPGAMWILASLGLLLAPQVWPLWVAIAGTGQGVGISTALTLVAVRPVDADHGRSVSAMVQSVAYALAALGPIALGAIFGLSGDWLPGSLVILGIAVALVAMGLPAAAPHPLGLPRGHRTDDSGT